MDGYGIIVDFDGDLLQVEPTSKFARSALGASQMSIAVGDIASASLKPASVLANGHLDVVCRDGRRYRLHFRRKQEPSFQELHRPTEYLPAKREQAWQRMRPVLDARPDLARAAEKYASCR